MSDISTIYITTNNRQEANIYFHEIDLIDLEGEIWESAFGLDGLYEVSNKGRVKSLERTVNYIDGRVRTFPSKIIKNKIYAF